MAEQKILPYARCFKVGVIDRPVDRYVLLNTPIANVKTLVEYSFKETMSISEFEKKYRDMKRQIKNRQIVLIGSYGLVRLPISKAKRNKKDNLFFIEVEDNFDADIIGKSYYWFSDDTLFFRQNIGERMTKIDHYTDGEFTFAKTIGETDRGIHVKYSIFVPGIDCNSPKSSHFGYIDEYLLIKNSRVQVDGNKYTKTITFTFSLPESQLQQEIRFQGELTDEKYDNLDEEQMGDLKYIESALEAPLAKIKEKFDKFPSPPTPYNFPAFYQQLKLLDPNIPILPIPKKEMKSLLAKLDTDISPETPNPERHKMGGPIMDPHLIHTIGDYIGKSKYYTSSVSEDE